MMVRTAARILLAGLLGLSLSGIAHGARSGHGGGHHGGSGNFHGGHFAGGGPHHFAGSHFHNRVFIGGTVFAPFYFPPPYYYPPYSPYYYPPTEYVQPYQAPAPQASYWYYCPGSGAYYPYVQQCPGGWQQMVPQPPS